MNLLGTWNVHSIKNKYIAVLSKIVSKELNIFVAAESWQ